MWTAFLADHPYVAAGALLSLIYAVVRHAPGWLGRAYYAARRRLRLRHFRRR
ncbi:MAG: hypothetical protein U1A78_33035 [Polyangia bacterium]